MASTDLLRVERLRARMRESNVDVLVCRLPENVLYLTDYWPHHGVSVALLPRDGTTLLFVPEIEGEYADPVWAAVVPFGWGLLKDGDLYESYRRLLAQASARLGLQGARVGVEQSFEIVGATYRSAEPVVPAAPWSGLLAQVFADAHLADATGLLQETRAVKTAYELAKLRIANEIAEERCRSGVGGNTRGQDEAATPTRRDDCADGFGEDGVCVDVTAAGERVTARIPKQEAPA